ncbi:UNVERIFIED_CONTAM: hypothetical protein NCL1_14010 [Trichonephila clavipes]
MLHVSRSVGLARKTEPEKCVEQAVVGFRRRKRLQNDNYREEISDFAQSILGFQECDEDVETWMAYDAEDCGFQMLHDDEIVNKPRSDTLTTRLPRPHDEIVTSEQEESDDETHEGEDNHEKESSKGP